MEVHKHPRHVTHPKKWAEYFLEFFMIFFAVFMGFLAENIREHVEERKKGAEYLNAYLHDLLQNQITFKKYDSLFTALLPVYDTITEIYHEGKENSEIKNLAALLIKGKRTISVPLSTTNYFQLVNSGSMRLIENESITLAMGKYIDEITAFRDYDLQIKNMRSNLYPEVLKIEDLHDFYTSDSVGNISKDHIPQMDRFPLLSAEQRRTLVNYYRLYIAQTKNELSGLKNLAKSNDELIAMINSSSQVSGKH